MNKLPALDRMGLRLNSRISMKVEIKSCPRCGESFACNNSNIIDCACSQIPLNSNARQLISESYDDCLCTSCLKEFSKSSISGTDIDS